MGKFWRILLTICLFVYPIFVFVTLVVLKKDMSIVCIGMLVIGVTTLLFSSNTGNKITPIIMCVASLLFIFTKSELVIKFYPFWITAVFGWMFLSSIIRNDPIIMHFAELWSPSIKVHPGREEILSYCLVWNWIWVSYFVLVEIVNLYFIFRGSTRAWAIYNGCISYIAQGLMFVLQFGVNFFFNKRIDKKYCFNRKLENEKLRNNQ